MFNGVAIDVGSDMASEIIADYYDAMYRRHAQAGVETNGDIT